MSVNVQARTKRGRITFCACMLLIAIGLVAVSCWLGQEFRIDQPGVTITRFARQPNSRGESFLWFFDLNAFDTRSEKLLWRAKTPGAYQHLVGDHYLVGFRTGRVEVIDIDDARAAPIDDRQVRQFEFASFGVDVPGLSPADTRSVFHAIPNSNRFILQILPLPDPTMITVISQGVVVSPPSTAYVFEIESRSVKLLTSWQCQRADLVVMPDGRVLSVAPNAKEVECRTSSDFQIESRRAFPIGLTDWQAISVRNHLFSYFDPKTLTIHVCRLDDFAAIPELSLPLLRKSVPEIGEDQRYHILSDGGLSRSRRLVVYDSTRQRIAFDSGLANGFRSADIVDGQLRLSTLAFGLSISYYDLQQGRWASVEHPFLWIIIAMPVVLLAGLAWVIVWITKLPCSANLIPLNIALVAGLFLTPLAWRTGRLGFMSPVARPPVEYSLSVVLAISFCLALYAVFGRWRFLLRCIPFLLGLTALFAYVHYSKSVDFNRAIPNSQEILSLRIWVTFSILSALVMGALRALGFSIVRVNTPPPADEPQAHIHLLDIFLMTAAVASALTVFIAQVDLLISPTGAAFVVARSAMLAGMACISLLALVDHPRLYRLATTLTLAVAVIGIVDIVVHVSCVHRSSELWYRVATDCRYPIFTALSVFAFCSIMRSADLRWRRFT